MSVKVLARIRPLLRTELDKDVIVTPHHSRSDPSNPPSIVHIPNPKNEAENFSFTFNRVFESHTTQQQLFDAEIKPTIKHLLNGRDITLFAYGVTGSGKTHTMRGGKALQDRGIVPRLLSAIYRKSRAMQVKSSSTRVEVSMSYYEIYNDKVFDLFEAPENRNLAGLPLRDNGNRTVVVGLTERPCEDLKTFERLYDQANVNRSTSATKLNAHSSRSHAILCVKLTVTENERTMVSTASCIDLAGSEDNRRTDNNKERLAESSAINKSLFVLGQCVEAISTGQSRIPYRESKMTRILSLGQKNGICICLLNLCPIRSFHQDTLSSLNFANRTKKIEVREVENEPVFQGYARPALALAPKSQRQVLGTLSHTTHNANVKRKSGDEAVLKPAQKPLKSFTVWRDSYKLVGRRSSGAKRASPAKRVSLAKSVSPAKHVSPAKLKSPAKRVSSEKRLSGGSSEPRAKLATRNPTKRQIVPVPVPGMTKDAIEDLVEKKVREVLASNTLDSPVNAQLDISEDVRKRLETLELKIEAKGGDEERAEGLSYLLMAKQHMVRGEQSSALKMYELAKDYFPDHPKLEAKIAKLRENSKTKTDAYLGKENIPPAEPAVKLLDDPDVDDEDEHRPDEYDDARDDNNWHEPIIRQPLTTKNEPKTKFKITPFRDTPESKLHKDVLTPRGKQVLQIVNSRNLQQIRALKGVGVKKAEHILEGLGEQENLASLEVLASLKGVGTKTVENMRFGLTE